MTVRTLCTVIMLCFYGTTLFAQTETDLSPLPSVLNACYVPFAKPVSACHCSKINSASEKHKSVFSLDIPLLPFWETVSVDTIKNQTVQFGESTTSWVDTTRFDGWPVPKIVFATSDFRMSTEGGVLKTSATNISRTMKQVRMTLDGSLWFVLIGADGLIGQEQIIGIMKGVNFQADFRRRSGGGQGWLGVKFGDFNHNFVTGRYGRGYIYTDGSTRFNIPDVDGIDWLPTYVEEFKSTSFSVEAKMGLKRIGQSVRFDRLEYERIIPSPDPLRFGKNRFEDLWLTAETEIAPFSKFDVLRGVIVLTKDFGDKNRLMFINDYSSIRFFVRLRFD